MTFIYRHALFVFRKQPYIDWANSLDDGPSLLDDQLSRRARTVYLVQEIDGEPELDDLLPDYWEDIFLAELGAWHLAEDQWPAPLTREMFDAWFEVELCASAYDLDPAEPMTQGEVDSLDLAEALEVCAGCGIEVDPEHARFAGFTVAEPKRLDLWRGRVLPLSIDDEHTVLCIARLPTSPETDAGDDLLVRVCSSQCEKAVRKVVPKALRQFFRHHASDQE